MQLLLLISLLLCAHFCWSLPISKNINSLSPTELTQYRDCVRLGLAAGRYLEVAGEHGVPLGLCPHGNLHFLPWHRHHLSQWEKLMNCTIPYWDWANDPIPAAFLQDSYTDSNGRVWPNPLKIGLQPHASHFNRALASDFPTAELKSGQDLALSRSDLPAFSSALEDAHNLLHVSVGGDMSAVDYASYDPVFYSHHKNVDRLWFIWQTSPSRNSSWISPFTNDYVRTAQGMISSQEIAKDLSAWIPPAAPSLSQNPNSTSSNATTQSSIGSSRTPESSPTSPNAANNQTGMTPSISTNTAGTSTQGTSPSAPSNVGNIQQGQTVSPSTSSVGTSPSAPSNVGNIQQGQTVSPSTTSVGSNGAKPASAGSTPMSNAINNQSGEPTSISSSGSATPTSNAINNQLGQPTSMSSSGSATPTSNAINNQPGQATSTTSSGSTTPMSTALNTDQGQTSPSSSLGSVSNSSSGSSPALFNTLDSQQSPTQTLGSSAALPLTSSSNLNNSGISSVSGSNAVAAATILDNYRIISEPPKQHVLMNIQELRSTSEGYLLNVILDGERIGRVGLLGMGRSPGMVMMSYKKDRLLDVTCHLEDANLQQVREKILFELFDDQQQLVARPRLNFTLFYEYY